MAQNGRTTFTRPDSDGRDPLGSNGAAQLHDAHRRRNSLVRRESARRAGTLTFSAQTLEATGYGSAKEIETAAQFLCDSIKAGRVALAAVQQDQIEDARRLEGWAAVGMPDAGTPQADVVAAIQKRMVIRKRALELHEVYDIDTPTSNIRAGQSVPSQPKWAPWRRGADSDHVY